MPRCCVDYKASHPQEEVRCLLRAKQPASFHPHQHLEVEKASQKGNPGGTGSRHSYTALFAVKQSQRGVTSRKGALEKSQTAAVAPRSPSPRSQQPDVPPNVGQDGLVKPASTTAPFDRVETESQGQAGSCPGSQAE